jgi:hypothetical protein
MALAHAVAAPAVAHLVALHPSGAAFFTGLAPLVEFNGSPIGQAQASGLEMMAARLADDGHALAALKIDIAPTAPGLDQNLPRSVIEHETVAENAGHLAHDGDGTALEIRDANLRRQRRGARLFGLLRGRGGRGLGRRGLGRLGRGLGRGLRVGGAAQKARSDAEGEQG